MIKSAGTPCPAWPRGRATIPHLLYPHHLLAHEPNGSRVSSRPSASFRPLRAIFSPGTRDSNLTLRGEWGGECWGQGESRGAGVANNVVATSLGHSSKGDTAVERKSLPFKEAQGSSKWKHSRMGWGTGWAGTHPVSFHTDVTFEPRKAILALGKTEGKGWGSRAWAQGTQAKRGGF